MCILCAGARRRRIIIIIAAVCVKPLTERASCLNCSKFVCVCVYVFESVYLWVMSMFSRLSIYTNTTHLHTCTRDAKPSTQTTTKAGYNVPQPTPNPHFPSPLGMHHKNQLDQYSCVFIFAIIAGIRTINRQHTANKSECN